MNRKTALKSILAFITVGASSGIIFEFLKPGDTVPLKLLPTKKALIAELAETIIPRTDTPGAKDAKVEDHILKMITENTAAKTQKSFLAGLSSLEHYTYDSYHKEFVQCTTVQRADILRHFENKETYPFGIMNKISKKLMGPSFFYKLRDLTVEGYCTSAVGATKGMAYDFIPVNFEACIPLKKHQLAWAIKYYD